MYVKTLFSDDEQHIEEDYIDLKDLLQKHGYNVNKVLKDITDYKIKE